MKEEKKNQSLDNFNSLNIQNNNVNNVNIEKQDRFISLKNFKSSDLLLNTKNNNYGTIMSAEKKQDGVQYLNDDDLLREEPSENNEHQNNIQNLNDHEQLILHKSDESKQPSALKRCFKGTQTCLTASAKYSGTAIFHILDFMRIWLVTQALSGRFLYQFFLEIDRYHWAPSKAAQKTWLGWPIITITLLAAGAAKIFNGLKTRDEHNTYPAIQDFVFHLFSSSILYMGLDVLLETKEVAEIPIWAFGVTSAATAVLTFFMWRSTITDSDEKITLFSLCKSQQQLQQQEQNQNEDYPVYQNDVSKLEKGLNIINGIGFGAAAIATLFWAINRETAGQTIGLQPYQILITVGAVIAYGVVGYRMTSNPKTFNVFTALAKSVKDGSLAYSSLSGLAFHSMMQVFQCKEDMCWDASINKSLTIPFVILGTAVGIYSALTTHFNFKGNHEANVSLFNTLKKAEEPLSNYSKEINNPETRLNIEQEELMLQH